MARVLRLLRPEVSCSASRRAMNSAAVVSDESDVDYMYDVSVVQVVQMQVL